MPKEWGSPEEICAPPDLSLFQEHPAPGGIITLHTFIPLSDNFISIEKMVFIIHKFTTIMS